MVDSSDDDDEPCFSSPEASYASDASDNDVFKFKAKRFEKAKDTTPRVPASSGKRKKRGLSVEEQLQRMENTKKQREQKLIAKIERGNASSDEEENEDVKVVSETTRNPTAVELLDSDSDNDLPPSVAMALPTKISAETSAVLNRTRIAAVNLLAAQHYHAEDIYVAVPSPIKERAATTSARTPFGIGIGSGTAGGAATTRNLGKILRLTCRSKVDLNGSKKQIKDTVLSIREHTALSTLVNQFLQQHSLPSTARCVLVANGERLDPHKTPATSDLEDEDVIDISIKAIAIPVATANVGPKINLRLRRKVGTKFAEVRMSVFSKAPLSQLVESFASQQTMTTPFFFSFDGEKLQTTQSPENYDMEDGDLIDVVVQS